MAHNLIYAMPLKRIGRGPLRQMSWFSLVRLHLTALAVWEMYWGGTPVSKLIVFVTTDKLYRS